MRKIIVAGVLIIVAVVGLYLWMGKENPTSINTALGMGKEMQCAYALHEGDRSADTVVAIDGEKFVSTTKSSDVTSYGLFDGTTQYTWTNKDKNGFKMSKACLEDLKKMTGNLTSDDALSPQNGVKVIDLKDVFEFGKDVKCEPAEVSVSVPTDVTFTDQCELTKQSMRIMEELKKEAEKQ